MALAPGFNAWTRLWSSLTRRGMEREVQEELAFHLEMLEGEHRSRGMTRAQARFLALQRFGDFRRIRKKAVQTKNAYRRKKRRNVSMDDLMQDFRYAIRGLLKSRGFTAVVLLTLTVGIGATVAMYGVLHAALRQALPFSEPDRLVFVNTTIGGNPNLTSFPDYLDYRDQSESFEALGAVMGFTLPVTVTGTEEPERVPMSFATGNLFEALGVRPVLGRTFSPEEAAPGGEPAMILSYGYWQRRFAGSPDVLGQTVNLNGTPAPVVGVMPADFHLLFDAEAWLAGADGGPMTGIRRYHNWFMIGRLKEDATVSSAQAELELVARNLEEAYPDSNTGKSVLVEDLHAWMVDDYRQTLFLLMGAIGLVLLIACGNVASLLMARGSARATEMAVRTALGAGRGRLVRQLLTESFVLALVAGGLGVLAAVWLQDLILGYVELDILGIQELGLSSSVLGFALVLSLATAILFGTIPALAVARAQPAQDLKEGGRGSTTGGAKFRSGLVVLQVAVSVILLIGSALLLRSFGRLAGVDPGFDPEGILAAEVSLPAARYEEADARFRFFTDLRESIQALPGVESVGMIDRLPIRNPGNNVALWAPERPPPTNSEAHYAFQRIVTPGYFRSMGVPVVAGRGFDDTDVAGGPAVIILSQASADTTFPGESPLGRQVAVDLGGDEPALFEVVGVVADQHLSSLRNQARLAMFFPYDQRRAYTMQLAVRTRSDPTTLIRPIQERLWAQDREIPLSDAESMTEALASSVSGSRAMATMLGLFSVVALLLSALGLYGVLAYFVTKRVHEIGIRMAMGASAGRVARLILGRGMILVTLGLFIGLFGALGAGGLMEGFLFQTDVRDPVTFGGVSLFFVLVALFSCSIPAWRALRVDPMVAFRAE
ncbi:MAG: ABC transporter permease [Gemmatimonadota bacterium]